ncbi:hypothetical protein ABE10_03040, partial [Bacillus toyonensis]|nr:hypothetical protein [Bacillus toyonensis]
GRARGAEPDHHGRHHQPPRTRPVHGAVRSGDGRGHGGRAAARRLPDRCRGLAVELLRVDPVRDRRARDPPGHAQGLADATEGPDRLPRDRPALHRRLAAPHLGHQRGQGLRLVEPPHRADGRRITARGDPLRRGRAEGRGAARPPADVPRSHLHPLRRGVDLDRHRDVRHLGLPEPVHADGPRRDTHAG